ncbi:hypothetical protein F901_02297 [Acinetobacter dispersus]|uniref:CSLREA domain-containing protein n=1 Tax=Acinetobacter dispersus TaxID=70348 RepID=UPI0002CF49EE|nr:CSLREA domain-containing protein [Acinetobacter dispersus]ENX54982.1 hypothetical protein F901_02297 [Acinetobacter dispersus]
MKQHYKKTLLATMMLATMPLLAATSSTPIKVTTFDDEDGGNLNACSLREAIKTAADRVSYGGCPVADMSPTTQKVIQLEKGIYTLNKELTPSVNISIVGASPVDWQSKNVLLNDIVNQYPAQIQLQTTIKAENSRIFNTTLGKSALTLSNLILSGGNTTGSGGTIYAGADVLLQNSQILNSRAKEGGAIFLAGPSSSLTLSKSLIQGNQAENGSVLAMSCKNDLGYAAHTISLLANSFVNNGSTNSKNMLEFCGVATVDASNNTIAQNTVNATTGNLIKFSGDTKAGTDPRPDDPSSILSGTSKLTLTNNTIVENNAFTTLLYDKLGDKTLAFNIIAYNGGNNSYACRYLLGAAAEQENVGLKVQYNALALKEENSTSLIKNICDVPKESLKENETNINLAQVNNIRTVLGPLQKPTEHTAFLPVYYPEKNAIPVKDDDKTKIVGLLDTGVSNCSSTDQRGLARITNGTLYYDPNARNTCDIGSIELMRFIAGDLTDLSNTSISNMVSGYQEQYDFFDNMVKNPNNPDFLTYYKSRLDQYKKLLDSFNIEEKRKETLKYRAIYIGLQNYQLPLPEDVKQTDGSYKLRFFSPDLYRVTAEPLGKGQINDAVTDVDASDIPNLVCKWNADLQQIIFYRKNDSITQAGDKIFCKYTITLIADESIKSSGLIKAAFTNIAPVVKDTSLTFKYQAKQKLSLNLLDFANDDGDTGAGGSGPENEPNKPHFWRNADGIELPIRLIDVPKKDLNITADRQGPCPLPDQKETCYGGNIYVQEVNAFNPFNFAFKYQVYDADGVISSNTATVRTINTATTTDDTRPADSGGSKVIGGSGGGSFGFYSVFGLFGLLAYRRFRK